MKTECDVCGDGINDEDGARVSIVYKDEARSFMLCFDCASSLVDTIDAGIEGIEVDADA